MITVAIYKVIPKIHRNFGDFCGKDKTLYCVFITNGYVWSRRVCSLCLFRCGSLWDRAFTYKYFFNMMSLKLFISLPYLFPHIGLERTWFQLSLGKFPKGTGGSFGVHCLGVMGRCQWDGVRHLHPDVVQLNSLTSNLSITTWFCVSRKFASASVFFVLSPRSAWSDSLIITWEMMMFPH